MENAKKTMITRDGLVKLEEELYERENVIRPEIGEKIKEARAQGDLSENAEYDAARDAQRENEGRIAELKEILNNLVVVDDDDYGADEVGLGKTIRVKNMATGAERTMTLVGTQEANSLKGLISNECPVGMALMKRKLGEIVEIELPSGTLHYEILSIEKTKKDE